MEAFPEKLRFWRFPHNFELKLTAGMSAAFFVALLGGCIGAGACLLSSPLLAQAAGAARQDVAQKPVVVQPGAPGEPSKTLPADTHGTLPPLSAADVAFMQGMIMHHSQAVEMTALIPSHTEDKDVRAIGAKIASSQADEIRMMQRWLAAR